MFVRVDVSGLLQGTFTPRSPYLILFLVANKTYVHEQMHVPPFYFQDLVFVKCSCQKYTQRRSEDTKGVTIKP